MTTATLTRRALQAPDESVQMVADVTELAVKFRLDSAENFLDATELTGRADG